MKVLKVSGIVAMMLLGAGCEADAGKREHRESHYQAKVAQLLGGETEVRVENGRVDILTKTHAIEVDFANKWKESIGQALWYGLQTNRKPGIVLILENPKEDRIYALQLESTLSQHQLDVKVWLWPDDFKEVSKR